MRNVDSHLLEVKMDEAVTHYINSHPTDESVHVDANSLALNVQDDGGRVTVMHQQNYIPICRQVPVSEHEAEGPWSEELLDPEGRLAALMAQFTAQHPRGTPQQPHHKEASVRNDVDTTVMLDNSIRLFNGQTLEQTGTTIVMDVPTLQPLPALQGIKRCSGTDWFNDKKTELKGDASPVSAGESTAPRAQSKKSLPHKKRISRRLRKTNGSITPHQDILVISCAEDGQHEEILPDNFVTGVQHPDHLPVEPHHITHEIRPVLLCQLCGEFYGEEQLKFYQHLKQHYEPHETIIIENPVPDLTIDKMTNSCIVDNVATLPDSIVELSLENTVPKTIYQSVDKHILYSTSDKAPSYTNNKVQYSVASPYKETNVVPSDAEKNLYETLEKLELYNCSKCNKSFRKQKQCEAHIKEAHSNSKAEEMGEFSEPEDLMEGIHVAVEEGADQLDHSLLPHLTVDNGHVHQDHARHWYLRGGCGTYCPVCPERGGAHDSHLKVLKEEVLQRILESEAGNFPDGMMPEPGDLPPGAPGAPPAPGPPDPPPDEHDQPTRRPVNNINVIQPIASPDGGVECEAEGEGKGDKKQSAKRFECPQCPRVFVHRNSLLYHMLSHSTKKQVCRECGKGFYTPAALKVHKRVHNGDRPCKCEICGRDFRQWSDLKYHKMSIHSNQKMFKCDFCDKEFARKYSLSVHRRIHTGERNYKCEYCNKSFRASSYRLSHMRTHTGDKPYKCNECEKCFRVAGDLRRHMLTHDKSRSRLDANKNKAKQKDEKKPAKPHNDPPKEDLTPRIVRKVAVASTTKVPLKSPDKKPPSKKKAPLKKTVHLDNDYTSNVEVFDTRQPYKFKEVYDNSYKDNIDFIPEAEKDLAMLRPMFRNGACDSEVVKSIFKSENTDGKMQVYTHVEKAKDPTTHSSHFVGPAVAESQISDMRPLDREVRTDMQGENAFIERLTALYNIPAV